MEEVIEAQRDIYDLPKSPETESGRAMVEDPFLWLNALFFSLNIKVAEVEQVLDYVAQMLKCVGSQAGGRLESSVGWSIWGKFSEEPGSLKMSLEKQGNGRRTFVGTQCARLWRWECVGHSGGVVHRGLTGAERAFWGGGQLGLSVSLNIPLASLPSITVETSSLWMWEDPRKAGIWLPCRPCWQEVFFKPYLKLCVEKHL